MIFGIANLRNYVSTIFSISISSGHFLQNVAHNMESEKSASSQKIDFWLGMYLWAFGEHSSKSPWAKRPWFLVLEFIQKGNSVILHNQRKIIIHHKSLFRNKEVYALMKCPAKFVINICFSKNALTISYIKQNIGF